ncbi:MAG TPA: exonuclease domain-containing protein [Kiritimatiellia bacterium]
MTSLANTSTAYVWFDTEYTTLDINRAALLQVAMIVTDADLKRLTPPDADVNLFVRIPPTVEVSPWIKENMPDLVARCRSADALPIEDVDKRLSDVLDRHVVVPAGDDKRKPVLAGNSIHADWYLAQKYLPGFMSRLHYRHLDVTALKLQWQDWFKGEEFDKSSAALIAENFPDAALQAAGGRRHDAYYDVCASIAELQFYRKRLMKV